MVVEDRIKKGQTGVPSPAFFLMECKGERRQVAIEEPRIVRVRMPGTAGVCDRYNA